MFVTRREIQGDPEAIEAHYDECSVLRIRYLCVVLERMQMSILGAKRRQNIVHVARLVELGIALFCAFPISVNNVLEENFA